MSYRQCVIIALRALRASPLRSILTMLGIIIGVSAVIAMVSVGRGASRQVTERIQSLGANLLVIVPGSLAAGGVQRGSGSRHTLIDGDAHAIARENPLVEHVAPKIHGRVQIVSANRNWSTTVSGVSRSYFPALDWDFTLGGSFTDEDDEQAAKVVVIGATVASRLFGEDNVLGQQIRIKTVPFVVVGVLEPKGQSTTGSDLDDNIYVPLLTARQRIFGGRNRVARDALDAIIVKVRLLDEMEAASAQIFSLLRQRHRIAQGQRDDFTLVSLSSVQATHEAASRTMGLLLLAVASVSLVVGGISIMNIMMVSVVERMREIGLRLALGARPSDIRIQFLVEALTLAVLGGTVGVIVGIGVGIAMAEFGGWPVVIGPETIAVAFGFSAIVGLIFGYYPARTASSMNPMEALRRE